MFAHSRREFLAEVGKGMLLASVGPAVSAELGLSPALAAAFDKPLTFGELEPLVGLMQDTPAARLQPLLVKRLKDGTDLKTLIAAGALANSRVFGGQDYIGYHAMMALAPAWEMSRQLPESERALPVLKVLYRNTEQIQKHGGRKGEVLQDIDHDHATVTPEQLRDMARQGDMQQAERAFARLTEGPLPEAYHSLLFVVHDDIDVHRVVLAWRAWDTLRLSGKAHAHTLLRQSLRFCVDHEIQNNRRGRPAPSIRKLLPQLFDEHKLAGRTPGTQRPGDDWIDRMCRLMVRADRDEAARAVAAALGEGIAPDCVSEAMSLAANALLMQDPGRTRAEAEKPVGSVHGASVGVHAADAANAWRNIARVSDARNTFASLIVGAYHTAGQHYDIEGKPFTYADQLRGVSEDAPAKLLSRLDRAVRANDQATACAVVETYGQRGFDSKPVFDALLRFAVSEDGALHAEKFYHTVCEEFSATRPAYRWRHLVGLARVSASEYGRPAPGDAAARRLLGVS